MITVYRRAPHRIHAHVALSVRALLLERVAAHACADPWRNIRDDLRQIGRAQSSSPNGTMWQVAAPAESARKRRKSLRIYTLPPLVQVA